MKILLKSWQEAEADAFSVRQAVFIQEQRVPAELELDEFDQLATHALAYQGTHCIATGRLVELGNGEAQIGRMAVLAQYRNQGVGKQILETLVGLAISKGVKTIILHSQLTAILFYEKLDFQAQGDTYDEAGIPHRNMMLLIPNLT